MYPRLLGLGIVTAALLAGFAGAPLRADDGAPRAVVERALEALTSPAERTRRDAVERLTILMPGARAAVFEALDAAEGERRLLLVEVLVADASSASIQRVLEELATSDDVEMREILRTLIRSPRASDQVLEVWRRHPGLKRDAKGHISRQAKTIEEMLRRAEAERLFLSRKSKSGSTGSYSGQYEVLEPYRREALDLCEAIIRDRALPLPGEYPAGVFAFLRPPTTHIEWDELRSMAAHALSELGQATDRGRIARLSAFLDKLRRRLDGYGYVPEVEFYETAARYSDLLVALYLIDRENYQGELDTFLTTLRYGSQWRGILPRSYRPLVQLRVGLYEEAVQGLEDVLDYIRITEKGSTAGSHYNLACAYAQWAVQAAGPTREARLAKALVHLTMAVRHQWSDIGWMEEDRDLEPLRNTTRYRKLLEEMRRANDPDGD